MTSHYEEYKSAIEELYKNEIFKHDVDKYIKTNTPQCENRIFHLHAVRDLAAQPDMFCGDKIIFSASYEDGCYPDILIAALASTNREKDSLDKLAADLDLMVQARWLLQTEQPKETDSAQIAMALLRDLLPLFQQHNLFTDCSIQEFENILIHKKSCDVCILNILNILNLTPIGGFAEFYKANAISEITKELIKQRREFWDLTRAEHGPITENFLQKLVGRLKKIPQDCCAHSNLWRDFANMVNCDKLIERLPLVFKHPHADNNREVVIYLDVVKNIFDLLNAYERVHQDSGCVPPPVVVKCQSYLAALLTHLGVSREVFIRMPVELPEDLRGIKVNEEPMQSDIDDAIKTAVHELDAIDICADYEFSTANWRVARNILARQLATVFNGFHFGDEIEYDDADGAKSFRLPDLDYLVDTSPLHSIFENYDVAFEAADECPKNSIESWDDVKAWVNYARDNFAKINPEPFPFECQWNQTALEWFETLRKSIADKICDVLDYVDEQISFETNKSYILELIKKQCEDIFSQAGTPDSLEPRRDLDDQSCADQDNKPTLCSDQNRWKRNNKSAENIWSLFDDLRKKIQGENWECDLSRALSLEEAARERVKIEAERKVTEARNAVFSQINHSILGTTCAVFEALRYINRERLGDYDKWRFRCAYYGAAIINQTAQAMSQMFLRKDMSDWYMDLLPDSDSTDFTAIVRKALYYSVPSIFDRSFSAYAEVSEKYFSDDKYCAKAEKDWFRSDDSQKKEWFKTYLGAVGLEFDDNTCSLEIGHKRETHIHFYLLFNQIFLNAISEAASTPLQNRHFCFRFQIIDDRLKVDLENSAEENIVLAPGVGKFVLDNYIDIYKIQFDEPAFDKDRCVRHKHLEIPLKPPQDGR